MTEPDLIEGGRPEARRLRVPRLRVPRLVWRIGSPLAALAVVAAVLSSQVSTSGSTPPPPVASPASTVSGDDVAVGRADVELRLLAVSQRNALIRDVPESYRDAAGLASTLRGGRTPGNFFLALAYGRTLYGSLLVTTPGERLVNRGPVQWEPGEFPKYADPRHRDVSKVLDSFLAVDTKLNRGKTADFSQGAFGPARLLGMNTREAQSIADIYEILDGAGVRDGLPN
jgi:hypothetical protein